MPLAIAVGGAAILGAGASISASNRAAKTAKQTAAANNALQAQTYAENKAVLSPYVATGNKATQSIEGLLGIGSDPHTSAAAFDAYNGSTEYASRLAEGNKQVTAALGGKGLLDSGAAQKALLKYGQTFASNEFGNYIGNLQTQQQIGLGAAGTQTGVAQNYASAVNNNNNNAANAQIAATTSNAAAINGILGSAVSAYGLSQGLGSSYGTDGVVLAGRVRNSANSALAVLGG